MFLCLQLSEPASAVRCLTVVPRVVADHDIIWCDVRGLPFETTIGRLQTIVTEQPGSWCAMGIAATPVAAHVAVRQARHRQQTLVHVPDGTDRAFLAPLPIDVLYPDFKVANLLDGAGVETCGDLAQLTRESVEIRFGAAGARLWRLARADDPRPIFGSVPRALPSASIEWTDYTLRRAERLLFVINALCGNVCTTLHARGEGAVSMTLRLSLANRTTFEYPVRAARATANQNAWIRLLRLALERIILTDAVTGIALHVTLTGALGGTQGDVFDRGFGTAHATEEAIAHILDDQGAVVVEPENSSHPLLDRRTTWRPIDASQAVGRHTEQQLARASRRPNDPVLSVLTGNVIATSASPTVPTLTLQLLPTPLRITVSTRPHRDVEHPAMYRDGKQTHTIIESAGPDLASGERWSAPYARAYFRCINDEGTLVWIYRDVRTNAWYLHGWWD